MGDVSTMATSIRLDVPALDLGADLEAALEREEMAAKEADDLLEAARRASEAGTVVGGGASMVDDAAALEAEARRAALLERIRIATARRV